MTCDYCYYIDKGSGTVMSDELLEIFTQQYIASQSSPNVLFTWHGGEPLLRGIAFYRRALDYQRRYAHGRHIDNCLQTNGTLLNDEWCEFLRDNRFLVGISIDGTQQQHDTYRHSRQGGTSWHEVMRGITLLQRHGVEWNAMATVNAFNADAPAAFYNFFRQIGCEFLQFTPVVEWRVGAERRQKTESEENNTKSEPAAVIEDYSVSPRQWGHFLCTVYDEWVRHDVGKIFVQLFDATLANWCGEPPGVCSMSPTCGQAAVIEADGTVYSCDHFVTPANKLGNIRQQPLAALLYGQRQQLFGQNKFTTLPRQCRECRWLFACHGECPKNRLITDCYGEPGLNYLCSGYREFFQHVASDMDFMKGELDAGRSPANIEKRKSRK